jgi:NAD(P)H dehydrogenase (quinone)
MNAGKRERERQGSRIQGAKGSRENAEQKIHRSSVKCSWSCLFTSLRVSMMKNNIIWTDMKILVILAHPDKESFNYAIAETAVNQLEDDGHDVIFHDLYREDFDPVLPKDEIPKGAELDQVISNYCDELSEADGIIIVHPNWWGQPPAKLKGWIDRVVRPGVAYEFADEDSGEGIPVGLLKASSAIVFNTSNTPEERERKVFGDPLESLWKDCIFGLCGVDNVHRRMFGVVVTSTPAEREGWLREVRDTVNRMYPKG